MLDPAVRITRRLSRPVTPHSIMFGMIRIGSFDHFLADVHDRMQ